MSWIINNMDLTSKEKMSMFPVLDVMASVNYAIDERKGERVLSINEYKKKYDLLSSEKGLSTLYFELEKLNTVFFVDYNIDDGMYDGLNEFPRIETEEFFNKIGKKIKKMESVKNILWEVILILKKLKWIKKDASENLEYWFEEIKLNYIRISEDVWNYFNGSFFEKNKDEIILEGENAFSSKLEEYYTNPDSLTSEYKSGSIGNYFVGFYQRNYDNYELVRYATESIQLFAEKKFDFSVDLYAFFGNPEVLIESKWKPLSLNFISSSQENEINAKIGDEPGFPEKYPDGEFTSDEHFNCGFRYGYALDSTKFIIKPEFIFS